MAESRSHNAVTSPAALAALFAALTPLLTAAQTVEFNRDVRPILSDKCFACHGADANHRKADLRLDLADSATADRKGSRAIVPGDLAKSDVWKRVTHADPEEVMPPPETNKSLSAAEKETIRKWIEQGAKYQKHWSFEPVQRPDVPKTAAPARNPLDAFLLARLEKDGLKFAPEADRRTLIRRVAFALTGLPPTPAEVEAFVGDPSPDAYGWMVDHYLSSPRFGEEMARHWLDVARYADTHGLHLDNERQTWAYRDYVINSFNANKPFHRFTVEQIAGDLLPNPTPEQLTATGFNRNNVTTSEGGSIDAEWVFRYAVDRSSTVMSAYMGLTGACAQCHDHKFDPISTKEFYSFYAFFHSAADPAMDGNAILTAPTARLPTPAQQRKRSELNERMAVKQSELDTKTAALAYVDPATVEPKPPVTEVETVWLDDEFPRGSKATVQPNDAKWVASSGDVKVVSGGKALRQSGKKLVQEFCEANVNLPVPQGATFFAHVYIDPNDPPKALMLQFHKNGWNHRAGWGDLNLVEWGTLNTPDKFPVGSLPEAGKWVKLEVSAEKVGLSAGDTLTGFAVTQYDGTVHWDRVGVAGRSDPASDPVRSFAAWRKERSGKDTPGVPPEANRLLKRGADKELKPEELAALRTYFLQQVCADTKPQLSALAGELDAIKREREALDQTITATFIFTDLPTPRESFVMVRGQYDKPGEKVEPGVPAFLPPLQKAKPDGRATRLDLARWLVSPEHPLTARVAVNRFWQQFFGTGMVKTSEDFGSQGQPPSHPELLDWLAAEFRDGGWDVKALVRLIVTSHAFRQDAKVTRELSSKDPENRLLARGPRVRLDAEQIRDNVLFVSGLLNPEMGGKGVKPYQPPNIWEPVGFVGSNTREYRQDHGPDLYRRSIYTFLKRTAPPPFMANFDAPNREQSCTRRERSNTPLQALQLMNDVQHFEAARALAERMLTEGGGSPQDRIAFAFRTVLARPPEPAEVEIVKQQLNAHLARYSKDEAAAKKAVSHGESKPKAGLPAAELAAYTLVANMVLNLDETLTRN